LYTAYLIAAIVMTLNVLEGQSPIASLFKCDFFVAHCAVPLHLQSFLLCVIIAELCLVWCCYRCRTVPALASLEYLLILLTYRLIMRVYHLICQFPSDSCKARNRLW